MCAALLGRVLPGLRVMYLYINRHVTSFMFSMKLFSLKFIQFIRPETHPSLHSSKWRFIWRINHGLLIIASQRLTCSSLCVSQGLGVTITDTSLWVPWTRRVCFPAVIWRPTAAFVRLRAASITSRTPTAVSANEPQVTQRFQLTRTKQDVWNMFDVDEGLQTCWIFPS